HPYKARKQSPDNLFTVAEEVTIEFEEEPSESKFSKALNDLLAKFSGKQKTDDDRFGEVEKFCKELVDNIIEQNKAFAANDELVALRKEHEELKKNFSALEAKLDSEPNNQTQRPAATGKAAEQQT